MKQSKGLPYYLKDIEVSFKGIKFIPVDSSDVNHTIGEGIPEIKTRAVYFIEVETLPGCWNIGFDREVNVTLCEDYIQGEHGGRYAVGLFTVKIPFTKVKDLRNGQLIHLDETFIKPSPGVER